MAKATVKAKKKKAIEKKIAKKVPKIDVDGLLKAADGIAAERWAWVEMLRDLNADNDLHRVTDRMVKSLREMQGPPKLTVEGRTVPLDEGQFQMLQSIQTRNFEWIAMRMVVACAEWGIRLQNFKAPKKACLRCGKAVKK